jgi:hypothetical protein
MDSKDIVISRALLAFGVTAALTALAHATVPTSIWRLDSMGGSATTLTEYSSIDTLATGADTGVTAAISPHISDSRYRYVFSDYKPNAPWYIYLTNLDSSGEHTVSITRYVADPLDPLGNFRTNTGGTTFNLSKAWSKNDDFYCCNGYFYRNTSSIYGSNEVNMYNSFEHLLTDTYRLTSVFSTAYSFNDRFFGFGDAIYRTHTSGADGGVTGFSVYEDWLRLEEGTPTSTTSTSGVNWSRSDMFIMVPNFIGVPTPGAMALLGLAGLMSRRRRI